MDHLAFYNTGCDPEPGLSRLKLWVRRQVRKVLLPPSRRLVEILTSLCHRLDVAEHESREIRHQVDDLRRRQEEQAARLSSTIAFGWDYVAMVRRLAVLEEHVDTLLKREEAGASPDQADPSVRFHGHEAEHISRS
ncbi:hypothetical protein P12x_002380 [Tundrisphaera lichenicola]|uniref:hypothetical protein n=1 Tax=Tundrisphaera lichenicola TaxID=2029860 RepID=UPI003EBF9DFC